MSEGCFQVRVTWASYYVEFFSSDGAPCDIFRFRALDGTGPVPIWTHRGLISSEAMNQ